MAWWSEWSERSAALRAAQAWTVQGRTGQEGWRSILATVAVNWSTEKGF